jgi:hypothetical protein
MSHGSEASGLERRTILCASASASNLDSTRLDPDRLLTARRLLAAAVPIRAVCPPPAPPTAPIAPPPPWRTRTRLPLPLPLYSLSRGLLEDRVVSRGAPLSRRHQGFHISRAPARRAAFPANGLLSPGALPAAATVPTVWRGYVSTGGRSLLPGETTRRERPSARRPCAIEWRTSPSHTLVIAPALASRPREAGLSHGTWYEW